MRREIKHLQGAKFFTPIGGTPARLSLQLPGWPMPFQEGAVSLDGLAKVGEAF